MDQVEHDPPPPRSWAQRISGSGTWVQLSLVTALIALTVSGVAVFVKAIGKADGTAEGLAKLEVIMGDNTKATGELTKTIISLQGDVKALSLNVGDLRTATNEGQRDAQERQVDLTRMRSDLDNMKERLVAAESALKAVEARVLSAEIRAGAGGGGK